jgi:hypothetical protein
MAESLQNTSLQIDMEVFFFGNESGRRNTDHIKKKKNPDRADRYGSSTARREMKEAK